MVWGIGVASGATIGAILIKFLDTKFLPPLLVIFIISAIARAIVIIWWVPKIKEIRETKKCSMHKALRYLLFKKTKHTLIEETHAIVSIKKYLETKPCTQKYLK